MIRLYAELAPEHSPHAKHLMQRLAHELYSSGVRVSIGDPVDTKVVIHQSVNADHRVVWVCKHWSLVLGYKHHEVIDQHLSHFITADTYAKVSSIHWPRLMAESRLENISVTMVTRAGALLPGRARMEALRDHLGIFERTFTRLLVNPVVRLAASGCTAFAIDRLIVMGV